MFFLRQKLFVDLFRFRLDRDEISSEFYLRAL